MQLTQKAACNDEGEEQNVPRFVSSVWEGWGRGWGELLRQPERVTQRENDLLNSIMQGYKFRHKKWGGGGGEGEERDSVCTCVCVCVRVCGCV